MEKEKKQMPQNLSLEALDTVVGGIEGWSGFHQIDSTKCTNCGTCAYHCPIADAIIERNNVREITECCIGCDLCASVCPTGAISY